MALALTIGVLVAGGVYLMMRRGMLRVVVGFVLLSHAVNLLLIASGGTDRREPAIGKGLDPGVVSDPLPQAFVLTAVVIAFAVTIFMVVLAVIGDGDDDTDLDLTGREQETPILIPRDVTNPRFRRLAPQDYHAYLDRADDTADPDTSAQSRSNSASGTGE